MPSTLPQQKLCPQHKNYFPDEDPMRPLEEYRINKEGRIHPVWCKRCTAKKMSEYRQAKGSSEPKQPSVMKTLVDALRDEVNVLAAQIELGNAEELHRLAEQFGQTAEQLVLPVLQYYVEQRRDLPSKSYDQRIDLEETPRARKH